MTEVVDDVHTSTKFLAHFLGSLDQEGSIEACAVLTAAQIAEDPSTCFWFCSDSIGAGKVYAAAVGAAIKCFPKGELLRDVAHLYKEEGEKYLNTQIDGEFETITLDENPEEIFCVFSVDSALWK